MAKSSNLAAVACVVGAPIIGAPIVAPAWMNFLF
jgi:hypothetical protein